MGGLRGGGLGNENLTLYSRGFASRSGGSSSSSSATLWPCDSHLRGHVTCILLTLFPPFFFFLLESITDASCNTPQNEVKVHSRCCHGNQTDSRLFSWTGRVPLVPLILFAASGKIEIKSNLHRTCIPEI